MLVLSRHVGERVVIRVPGMKEPIIVAVSDVDRGKVRLGFQAPRDVKIDRQEVVERESA